MMSPIPPASTLKPADLVIFGGTGDLALRKILPALYYRWRDGQLGAPTRIIGVGRSRHHASEAKYIASVKAACRKHVSKQDFTEKSWKSFAARISYVEAEAGETASLEALKNLLAKSSCPIRVFYLATPANAFGAICGSLYRNGLIHAQSRVVLEKPIGHERASFHTINTEVLKYFSERQVYRIDHYLGKETVQNLMILRFANQLFQTVWDHATVDHVQITVAEALGVGNRAAYYDQYGTLRDMVQNHLLQLLCLIAMEPPAHIAADTVRDEKLKVLRALRPPVLEETVRGQYRSGKIGGKAVPGYLADIGRKSSNTETFVAIKAHIDNWRWKDVPFYLRTGKRMPKRYSEVVLQFKPVPHQIFPHQEKTHTNKLVIRLQPDESVKLEMITKVPGPGGYRLKPVHLNLSLTEEFEDRFPDAYERLLMDVVRGNLTLFMRSDEVEAAWKWTEVILETWMRSRTPRPYAAGREGPKEAAQLIERDGRHWFSDE
jgi:glucose-6-phosphate 1-dehydrogenase